MKHQKYTEGYKIGFAVGFALGISFTVTVALIFIGLGTL
jgi:hypothetical protein